MKSPDENHLMKKAMNPIVFIFISLVATLGAVLGMKLIITFGFSPYSAIIGVMLAMVFARFPIQRLKQFHSIHQQNLIQTSITCATFGAGNCLLVPIGIPYLMGREDLVLPMLIGASLAMLIDTIMIYRLFDTKLYPVSGGWPQGVATAEAIQVGDQGGKRVKLLGSGMVVGIVGSLFHVPLSAIGMALISDTLPFAMLGGGMLIRSYSTNLFNIDIGNLYIPHGVMIGAGIVILFQTFFTIFSEKKKQNKMEQRNQNEHAESLGRTTLYSCLAYVFVSIILAILSGFITSMSLQMFMLFILFAVITNFFQQLIVGKTSMKTGYFPAFSLAFVYLVIGMFIGFPLEALGLLVGLSAATGPVFAGMGYSLKTGYILRGNGRDVDLERKGRQQQLFSVLITLAVTILVVFFSYKSYFSQNLIPPVDFVFLTTMKASISTEIIKPLFIGALLGGALQLFKGTGILFATGLLLITPLLGWMILLGVVLKLFMKRKNADSHINIFAAGLIAGDVLGNLFGSIFKK